MSADPSIPGPSSQTDTDFQRQGTVPLRQHLQALTDAAASRIEQQVKLVEGRLDQRINDAIGNFDDKLKASREPVVTLREHISTQMDALARTGSERLVVINEKFTNLQREIENSVTALETLCHTRFDAAKLELGQVVRAFDERIVILGNRLDERLNTLITTKLEMNRTAAEGTSERLREVSRRFDESQNMVTTAMVASEKQITAAMLASDRAVTKQEADTKQRFEAVNEWRDTVNDLIAKTNLAIKELGQLFMQRLEADARFSALAEKIDGLQGRMDRTSGAGAGMQQGWLILIGAIGAIAAVVGIVNFATRSAEKPGVIIERVVPAPRQSGVT